MVKISEAIMNQMAQSKINGYKPVAILINKATHDRLKVELIATYPVVMTIDGKLPSFLQLKIILFEGIPDFQLIDNRSWTDQVFKTV